VKKEKDLRSITHYRVMQQTQMTEEPLGIVVCQERLRLEISPEEELEIMYGSREEREAMFTEVERYDEERRQQEHQEGARGDVEMENAELPEASTTPTSLEEPNFLRIVIEAAMEASNLALNTNGDDLEVMMRIVRDTAREAFEDDRTPRRRLRIWRRRCRARLEGRGIFQRSLTRAEMGKRSRPRTSRATRTTKGRSSTEEAEEPEAEDAEGIESEGRFQWTR